MMSCIEMASSNAALVGEAWGIERKVQELGKAYDGYEKEWPGLTDSGGPGRISQGPGNVGLGCEITQRWFV